jgi:RNA polymerase sigma-70 factor, ECF subfamily
MRDGDENAFVALVNRYQDPMLRVARAMVPDLATAEDVVQDTWIGVVRGIERFEGRSSLRTWLFRILANRARTSRASELGRSGTQSPIIDPARFDRDGAWTTPPERWIEESDRRLDAKMWRPILLRGLDSLPPRQRQVVVLRDVEGLSSAETASVLGISAANQRVLLHRGRTRLREVLDMAIRSHLEPST